MVVLLASYFVVERGGLGHVEKTQDKVEISLFVLAINDYRADRYKSDPLLFWALSSEWQGAIAQGLRKG